MTISAIGHAYVDSETGTVLDTWYPTGGEPARSCLAEELGFVRGEVVEIEIDPTAPPAGVSDAYLRLHRLSRREAAPNEQNLDGIFGNLTNVAWTTAGPVLPERADALRAACATKGHNLTVHAVDKFPQMLDYVIPEGVRIAIANRVRLGAHLADGTTVMHEGFVNFNAGTTGPTMVEGRISQGVVVGAHSDVGGGASFQGTLSGGGTERVSMGDNCLLGANAGLGIAVGDNCTVEAGLYITAGTLVTLPDGEVVKARDISGISGMLFRRNSKTGTVEAISNTDAKWQGLNDALHAN